MIAAQADVAADATRASWRLLEMPDLWGVALSILPIIAVVSALGYWRESLPRPARITLISLRFLSLALLLTVLFRPVKVQHQENVEPAEVMVLVDDSASMRRRDAYAGDSATRTALQRFAQTDLEETSRLDLARAGLQQELLPLLERGAYKARTFRFDDGFAPLADLESAQAKGHATHLGDAIASALASHSGRHVTDVVVISDGRSNGGVSPLDAASRSAAAGIPIHTVVVGDTRPEKNLIIELVEAPTSVLEGDEVALSVRVSSRGTTEATGQIVLEELPSTASGEGLRTIATEEVTLSEAGERVVLVAPPSTSSFSTTERRFRLSVDPLPEETLLDDNSVEVSVRISTEKIRGLYVDGYPRYEYRFLHRMLLRADERIQVQVYLMSATPDFRQEATDGVESLKRVPTDRKELLDNYDVIILGDVNPYSISPDPTKGEEFVASLFEFVERGGGLCLISGEYDNPKSIAGTELAKLLPVVLDTTGALAFESDTQVKYKPQLEEPNNPHEIVRLHPDLDINRKLWEEPGGLDGLYWYYPVVDVKPGSQVLLRHPVAANSHGRYPLVTLGYYPSGRTMFLSIDSTWRWRRRYVDRYHGRFWRNAIRWLALGRLKGSDRRFGLEPMRNVYSIDERGMLEARVLDEDYRPSEAGKQEAFFQGPDGPPSKLELTAIEGRAGIFRGSFDAERPGLYRAWLEDGGMRVASTEIEIVLPSRENADPSPDPQTLASIASLSGGRTVPLREIASLAAEFPGDEERREPISSQLKDAWDNWWTLIAALLILSVEWVLRKRYELI